MSWEVSIVLVLLLNDLVDQNLIGSLHKVFWNNKFVAGVWIITLSLIHLSLKFLVVDIFGVELFEDFVQVLLI